MMYLAYQRQDDALAPIRLMASQTRAMLAAMPPAFHDLLFARTLAASLEMIERYKLTHVRPSFHIPSVVVGNREVPVTEEKVRVLPFGTLLRFAKDVATPQPRVLVVAPMSGHFATLLRGTIETLLPDHDVYVTDWHNARDVPAEAGRFGVEDYVDYIVAFLETMGEGSHLVAVCQPCVQALAAAAIMAEDDNPAQPRSMTLMAGPIDTRLNPTKVNELATSKPIAWFRENLIDTVPSPHPGVGRSVYPGFVQLTAFMAMNMPRHVRAHQDLFDNLFMGRTAEAETTKTFYDEYFAVLDLPADFYLETVEWIFQEHRLAKGTLTHRGRRVNPAAIRKTSLLTVEGERDDICAIGQTLAAQDLCSSLKPYRKRHHMQVGVGHYGVFSGRKWQAQVYPLVKNTILASE
jgi:polyhydroxyalkanoate depolymerase